MSSTKTLPLRETIDALPPIWQRDVLPEINEEIAANPSRLFVLDDDPTGPQTVHDVAFLTDWSKEALLSEFRTSERATFILTNSRSVTQAEAIKINAEVGSNILLASLELGKPISVISRSDSTLRGHFPSEVEALAGALNPDTGYDGLIFIPFFIEGGRYTVGNVQYSREGHSLVPVAETPFAKDTAFGYKSSNLREWMEEKYGGRVKARDISAISIEDIRLGGPSKVQELLEELIRGEICIVNAADMRDLDVVALAVLRAERLGKKFLFRTSASFVRSRIGQSEQQMLSRGEIASSDEGGALILVGSHVRGSTLQLEKVLDIPGMNGIELDVFKVIDGVPGLIRSIINQVEEHLSRSEDVTVYTSRELVTGESPEEYLRIGAAVTDAMSAVVAGLSVKPRYLVSKGGMTSSNVTKNALNMKRALVPGQIFPGVLVLQMGPEAKYPGMRFILFPGNVGDPEAIADVVRKMDPSDVGT